MLVLQIQKFDEVTFDQENDKVSPTVIEDDDEDKSDTASVSFGFNRILHILLQIQKFDEVTFDQENDKVTFHGN